MRMVVVAASLAAICTSPTGNKPDTLVGKLGARVAALACIRLIEPTTGATCWLSSLSVVLVLVLVVVLVVARAKLA